VREVKKKTTSFGKRGRGNKNWGVKEGLGYEERILGLAVDDHG